MRKCDSADMIIVAYGRKTGFEDEKEAFFERSV